MHKCAQCGGHFKRIHRGLMQRFRYLAIYRCRDCGDEVSIPRQYSYHFGPFCRCPRCGTIRVTRLKELDRIDPMKSGLFNLLERIFGGKLSHCCFCRLQFYDRRPLSPDSKKDTAQTLNQPLRRRGKDADMPAMSEARDT